VVNPIYPVSVDPFIVDPETGLLRAHEPERGPDVADSLLSYCSRCGRIIQPTWMLPDTSDSMHNPENWPAGDPPRQREARP
jgi:hypothetical protein